MHLNTVKAGRHYVSVDAIASIEFASRDRMGDFAGVVVVPLAIIHLKHPLMRSGEPPAWRIVVDGTDALVIREAAERGAITLKRLAAA